MRMRAREDRENSRVRALYARGTVFCRYCRYYSSNVFKEKDLFGNGSLNKTSYSRYLSL
jgi:hypothetical protein